MVSTRNLAPVKRKVAKGISVPKNCFIVLESREGYKEHPVVGATVVGPYQGSDFLYQLTYSVEGQTMNTLRAQHRIFDTYQKGFLARTQLYTRYGYNN